MAKNRNNEKKQYIVFGLGRFGKSIAEKLTDFGYGVTVVDHSREKANEIENKVINSYIVDLNDFEAVSALTNENDYDGAIIAIGQDLEAAINCVMWAVDNKIEQIYAKASSPAYGRVLTALGASRIIYPERDMGMHLAHDIVNNDIIGSVELADGYSLETIFPLKKWVGRSLREIDMRGTYGLNVVGIRKGNHFSMDVKPDEPITEDDRLVVLGKTDTIENLIKK